jgi:hypothetical protein
LFSYQLGWSFEHYARDRTEGQPDPDTGGNEWLLHPTFVYSPGGHLLFFGMVSVPVSWEFRDVDQRDRFRLGTGVLYSW